MYTIVTVVVMVIFLGLTAMEGSRVADDLPTPWLGIKERTWAYAYQVWIAVFAARSYGGRLRPSRGRLFSVLP